MADPASLTISVVALGLSFYTFAWQHLRKSDSALCTLVAYEFKERTAGFQFSIANLGNRATLLRDVQIFIEDRNPKLNMFQAESKIVGTALPQVIKPGEIAAIRADIEWSLTFLSLATKASQERGEPDTSMFFGVRVIAWNMDGKKFIGQKQFITLHLKRDGTHLSWDDPTHRTFKLTKEAKC